MIPKVTTWIQVAMSFVIKDSFIEGSAERNQRLEGVAEMWDC